MPDPLSDRHQPAQPAQPGQPPTQAEHRERDLPRDHHPETARSPEEYTAPPGSHRKGRNGPATDVGA